MSGSKDKNGSSGRSRKEKDKDSKSQKKESKASHHSDQASGVRGMLSPNNRNGQSSASGSSQSKSKHGGDHSAKYPTSRKRFICPTCGNSYARDEDLRQHIGDAHASPRHACDQCRQKFRQFAELEMHKFEMHAPKPAMLPNSDRELSGKRSLLSLGAGIKNSSRHSSYGHTLGFMCPICGLSFSNRETLRNHYDTIHKR